MAVEEPIVIYRSVNREGLTFALKPSSRDKLRARLGGVVHVRPRIFIAHETNEDYESMHVDIAPQVILLLTGVSKDRLADLGGVEFRDAVTELEISAA